MAAEGLVNLFSTTVGAGGIAAGTVGASGTLPVVDPAPASLSGLQFAIIVNPGQSNQEIMEVTAGNQTTGWTVTRGSEGLGTSGAASAPQHFAPEPIEAVITVQGLKNFIAANSGAGTTFGTPSIALGTTAAAGVAPGAIRTDATIVAFDTTAPTTQAFGDAAGIGTVTVAARRDHRHGMPATPLGRVPHLIVAASNASATWKSQADYVCTGINDHTTINTALTALGAGTVQLSDGTFNCGGSIIRGSNQVLAGVGGAGSLSGATKLVRASGTAPVVTNNGSAGAHVIGGGIYDLTIDCQSTAGAGIQCHYTSTFLFWRVEVDNALGEGLQCVETWDSTLFESRFNSCGSTGATGTPSVGLYQTLSGVPSTDTCNNIRFLACTWESFTDGAIKVLGTAGVASNNNIYFENCKIESVTGIKGAPVTLDTAEQIGFRGCHFVHGQFAAGFSTPIDTIHATNTSYFVLDSMFETQDVTRSLRSFVSLGTGCSHCWISNLILSVGSVNYPTVAGIDATGSGADNQIDVQNWWFDGHGSSVLLNNVATSRIHRAAVQIDHPSNAELIFAINGTQKIEWNWYDPNGQLGLWDFIHSRDHILVTPGASSTAALTEFLSTVQVDGYIRHSLTTITASATINATTTLCDATTGPISATLPAMVAGLRCEVKKKDSSANAVTVVGTIDGGTNYVLANFKDAVTVVCDGSGWWVV